MLKVKGTNERFDSKKKKKKKNNIKRSVISVKLESLYARRWLIILLQDVLGCLSVLLAKVSHFQPVSFGTKPFVC